MNSQQIRDEFISFFEERDHILRPSASLIPVDPTLLLNNAGMVPFKPYFLGEEEPPWNRAVSIQKCVRTVDIDIIGTTTRHFSFFEMAGNFSFGDYFKAEAIAWAWEFYTKVLGLEPDRMWVTCHVDDDEAAELWIDGVGFPAERLQRLGKENFWEMGDTGPCGPSSEIFWDFGPDIGPDGGPANPAAEDRYVEIWNLVFQQYFRRDDGSLRPLESQNIDTGAGLERNLGVILGSPDVFDTDELAALVEEAQALTGVRLGVDAQSDVALKLLADHARTMTFLVSDGVVPSNEDRGFVLRRIVRRAIRFAYLLGVDKPVTPALAEATIALMGDAYPELRARADMVVTTLGREEDQFRRTLRSGLTILDTALAEVPDGGQLPGSVAFALHDTYGFPLEVTSEIVEDRGVVLDRAGFDEAMAGQRHRAREAAKKGSVATGDEADAIAVVLEHHGTTEFVGRETFSLDASIVGVVPAADGTVSVFLDQTPFYAESGGQVGDTGTLDGPGFAGRVTNTVLALPGLHRHVVAATDGEPVVGSVVTATIDIERRDAIRRNHTATHLLHRALREVLGGHVQQQGSLVTADRLRFDFSHFEAVTDDQVRRIEDLVNADVLANEPVRHFETTKAEAAELGAIAFFGEKYGEIVRVLEAGPHSTELCGGTHVRRTGDIGPAKVTGESSIGSNLRRIEAITGFGPIDRIRREEAELADAAARIGVPRTELLEGIDKRLGELRDVRAEVKALKAKAATGGAADLAASADDGVVVARVDGLARDDLRSLAVAVRDQPDISAAVLIGAPEGGGVALVAAAAKGAGLDAAGLIADGARAVGGGGGKNPDVAVAGGKDPTKIDDALELARAAARSQGA